MMPKPAPNVMLVTSDIDVSLVMLRTLFILFVTQDVNEDNW